MKTYFLELLEYDRWAGVCVHKAIASCAPVDSEEHKLFLHIRMAHFIWVERMRGLPVSLPFKVEPAPFDTSLRLMGEAQDEVEKFIRELDPARFDDLFDYLDSKGNPYRSTFREILTHILNHATHHRGQINMMLRARGLVPPVIDFAMYRRDLRRSAPAAVTG
jgi:uncharacterized damage-inducible protein DinB